MAKTFRRVLSMVLAICMLAGIVPAVGITASAAATVTIESFMRGEQTDYRSSELLVANVEGYEGNPLDLTYEWTNTLGTYLYVYNSHNMYGVNNTDGEIEIYNSDKGIEASANMAGRTYNKKFSGTGYAYAAVYGANINNNTSLVGTVTVTVKDKNGNVIGTDSHTGTVTESGFAFWKNYTYHGFVKSDLSADLESVAFGLFEGNSRNVKNLMGESAVVHVTCVECSASEGKITSGSQYASLTQQDGDYYVTGIKAGTSTSGGDAVISMTIEKGNCKFHNNSETSVKTTIYVYKKPVPVPTTTTITLKKDSLDSRCRYFIHGVEGTKQADGSIIFTGLTPNTDYEIEVMGKTTDTDASYAYVYTKTLPVYVANVEVYLNGCYNIETGLPYDGELVNINTVTGGANTIYIKAEGSNEYVLMDNTATGKYSAGVPDGNYHVYDEKSADSAFGSQYLTISGADRTRYLFYYSVEYNANGGTNAPATAYYYEGSKAVVSETVPTYDGYDFIGWMDENGKLYQPGDVITNDIEEKVTLVAQWKKSTRATVNVTLVVNHEATGGVDPSVSGDATIELTHRHDTDESYTEMLNTKKVFSDWYVTGTRVGNVTTVKYEALYTDLPTEYDYLANAFIPHYEATDYEVKVTKDAAGNETYDVVIYFDYNPDLFELGYDTVADESIPDELIPQEVDIKILSWNTRIADAWSPITRHVDSTVGVRFNGRTGHGSYGVPVYNNNDNAYYRVSAASLTLADGTELILETDDGVTFASVAKAGYADGAFTAVVSVIGGKDIENTDLDGSYGVYIEERASGFVQKGDIIVTVYANRYDVIFNSNGGSAIKTIEDVFAIPAVDSYVPTKNGYTFNGWYMDSAFTTPVQVGKTLTSDVTLYAKWEENRTVKGTVSLHASYKLNGAIHNHVETDRPVNVTVLLQKLDANGYPLTIATSVVALSYTDVIGSGTYEFKDIPADNTSYRIRALLTNFTDNYQNELSASTSVTDYDSYDAEHYRTEFNGDSIAIVNAHLDFAPENFDLKYEVVATAIGEGFRPDSTELLVLSDDGKGVINPQNWPVISQMDNGGDDVALANGKGSSSYPVWKSRHDGTDLYDYTIKLNGYTVDGTETVFDAASAPFMVYYNGIARYSALNGQTHTLVATLVPKMYTIYFNTDSGEDEIIGMNSYTDTYYWSFGKEITASPIRTGYKFLGWFDADGNKVTNVPASMAENVYLTAKWEKMEETYESNYAYIFGYNDTVMGAEGPLLRAEISAMIHRLVKQNGKLGDFVYNASNPSFSDIEGEWFQSGIEFMHHKGAFTAAEGTKVMPLIQITRGEAFKMICLGLGFTTNTTLTVDEYAQILNDVGYVLGDENGNLNVGSLITRAEFCTLYNRIIGREYALLVDANGNEITAETYGFTDLDSEKWYYEAMVRATSAYDKDGYVDISLRGIRNDLDDYNY